MIFRAYSQRLICMVTDVGTCSSSIASKQFSGRENNISKIILNQQCSDFRRTSE